MFLSDDFLLKDDWAKKLYHSYAKNMPIIDYHCHLDPKEIYENNNFSNLTEAWLGGDHYKWRLMRACGVPEEKITGNASDFEKSLLILFHPLLYSVRCLKRGRKHDIHVDGSILSAALRLLSVLDRW